MKRFFISAAVIVSLFGQGASAAGGDPLETVLSEPESFYRQALEDFIDVAARDFKSEPVSVNQPVAGQLELLTQLAGSYYLSVKDLERAYNLAVKKGVEGAFAVLKECVENDLKDPDEILLFGEITANLKGVCGRRVYRFAAENAKRFMREALQECNLLKYSPLMDSFLKDERCSSVLYYYPSQVEGVLFGFLKKEEKRLYSDPSTWRTPRLRAILGVLKRNGLLY
ncbi:hypothetical protein [Thermovibrio ammonificans]|jgi:hypothetical protein|uniref:Uncharacterized protein n=1 Tax=Thermovibrio ammonificans (strain DSM 15698 / JCM 12110 / HB-1) TaxID=648996 RepID=E8T221_THEA1|nr:hypothetical protein [Thermovibrio ammonificans]ADU96916.1 hypothetical protein Theam_0949 [Thermovibrio ammonificans HB-1]